MSPVPPALSLDVVQRRRKWFAGLVLLALIVLTASVRSVAVLDGEWHELQSKLALRHAQHQASKQVP